MSFDREPSWGQPRRREVLAATLGAVAVGLAAGLSGCAGPGSVPRPTSAGVGSAPGADADRVAALAAVLRSRAQAYARGDRDAWLAAVSSGAGADQAREDAAAYELMRALGVTRLSYAEPRVSDGVVASDLSYVVAGVDTASCVVPTTWDPSVLPPRRLGVPAAPWEQGGMAVARRDRVVVVAGAPAAPESTAPESTVPASMVAAEVLSHALDAVAAVRRLWGEPGASAVLLLPPSPAIFARWAGDQDSAASLPAVTVGPVVGGRSTGCDRVVVNPDAWRQLRPDGRRVVLTHEVTHLVLRRDVGGEMPGWLAEGYCEYVAYAGVDLPEAQIVAPLLREVRRSGVPPHLPSQTAIDGQHTLLGADTGEPPGFNPTAAATPTPGGTAELDRTAAYAAALLACRVLAERAGPDGLTGLVRQARGSDLRDGGVAGPLRRIAGWTPDDLERAWRDRVHALAALP
ncbi:MAG: hypothetical protein LCH98_01835 [Actinobacteria bacterium]|nr:hypothetical protein [Actinomycetota bacterium]